MVTTPELWLPSEYDKLMTDDDRQIHEELAHVSLREFADEAEAVPRVDTGSIVYADLRHPQEGDSSRAVALLFPYGNAMTPSMLIRARMMQALLPEPTRVMMFPNNSNAKGHHYYDNDYDNDTIVSTRAVRNLAGKVNNAIESAGVEKVGIVGWSQGASVGAAMLFLAWFNPGIDTTGGVMLGDPADVVDSRVRPPSALRRAHLATGVKPLQKAINDSGIPALSEAQESTGPFAKTRMTTGFVGDFFGSRLPSNRNLHESMAQNAFREHLHAADQQGALPAEPLIVRTAKGNIFPKWVTLGGDLDRYIEEISDYGHEAADNVVLHALLARKAMTQSGLFIA